jgi:serine/threonine-protein kinase
MQPPNIDPRAYAVQRELGRGTTGVVYQARDAFDRVVALKVPQFRNDLARAAQSKQFFRESRVLAGLTFTPDPGIPKLHAVGDEYHVREFIDAETLEHGVTSGSISLHEGIACLERICRVVARVHARGVAHRNLHPANILIARDGTPKLIGFGRCGPLSSPTSGSTNAVGVDVRGIQGILNWICTILQQPVPAAVDAAQQPGAADSAVGLADLLAQCVQDWDAG